MPSWGTPTAELVKPDNMYGFDTSIPAQLKDKVIAHKLVGLFSGLADTIEHDGTRSKPEILYVANMRDVIREAVNIEFDGQTLGKASGLGDVVGPVFEKELPDGTVELDKTRRAKSVDLCRAVAYACALVK